MKKRKAPQHYLNFDEYCIDLGSSARGYRRYKVLRSMLQDVIHLQRHNLDFDDAYLLQAWGKNATKSKKDRSPFLIHMSPTEWGALSRGLRALNTTAAKTLYQWCNTHKVELS